VPKALELSIYLLGKYKHRGRRWLGKTGGAIGFALIPIAIGILWLLSFFQEKESDNTPRETS
jgi:hypothetical protein